MRDAFCEDLSDFIRNDKLDAYELTDDELAQFLEVWRWATWRRRTRPNAVDADIADAVQQLQTSMMEQYGVEVDYNTLLLLRQELEPLMYWRILAEFRRALVYFLHPRNLLSLLKTLRRVSRYAKLDPLVDRRTYRRGYPRLAMGSLHDPAPDLLKRHYWRQVGMTSAIERRRTLRR
ncbi:MAG: hypothetical protein DIU68_015750 [Chloroflexota bacterium]|nr:MAG: hypothetical protein DIU68_15515 [Chloroflexota bacterium]